MELDEQLDNVVRNCIIRFRLSEDNIAQIRVDLACCETLYGLAGDNNVIAREFFKKYNENKISTT